MDLSKLKQEIPYRWRVQSFSKFKPEATCVAYIDSRQVQDLLDDVVGPGNWQDNYSEHKNNLFCSIGIKTDDGWVWKTDCGIESNVDKEKGEASDAFKRAAVKWGIGRFLYSKSLIRLPASEVKKKDTFPKVVDNDGKWVSDLTRHINTLYGFPTFRELTAGDVKKWNGSIENGIVVIDGEKVKPTIQQLEKLKNHEKHKKYNQQNQQS